MKLTCTACWKGKQELFDNDTVGNCDACGLPGPKPPDYEWPEGSGIIITHYVNHGNTWQSAPLPQEPQDRWTEEGRWVEEDGRILYDWPPVGRFKDLWKRFTTAFNEEEYEEVASLLRYWSEENSTLVAYEDESGEWHDVEPNWADPEAWTHKTNEDE